MLAFKVLLLWERYTQGDATLVASAKGIKGNLKSVTVISSLGIIANEGRFGTVNNSV